MKIEKEQEPSAYTASAANDYRQHLERLHRSERRRRRTYLVLAAVFFLIAVGIAAAWFVGHS